MNKHGRHENKDITKKAFFQTKHDIHFLRLAKCQCRTDNEPKIIDIQKSGKYSCLEKFLKPLEHIKSLLPYNIIRQMNQSDSMLVSLIS